MTPKTPTHYPVDLFVIAERLYLDVRRFSALKYIARAGKKEGVPLEKDINKAIHCLELYIEAGCPFREPENPEYPLPLLQIGKQLELDPYQFTALEYIAQGGWYEIERAIKTLQQYIGVKGEDEQVDIDTSQLFGDKFVDGVMKRILETVQTAPKDTEQPYTTDRINEIARESIQRTAGRILDPGLLRWGNLYKWSESPTPYIPTATPKKPYTAPYRVGRKQQRAILDAEGKEVIVFPRGSEAEAQEYCDLLNAKYAPPPIEQEYFQKPPTVPWDQPWDQPTPQPVPPSGCSCGGSCRYSPWFGITPPPCQIPNMDSGAAGLTITTTGAEPQQSQTIQANDVWTVTTTNGEGLVYRANPPEELIAPDSTLSD